MELDMDDAYWKQPQTRLQVTSAHKEISARCGNYSPSNPLGADSSSFEFARW